MLGAGEEQGFSAAAAWHRWTISHLVWRTHLLRDLRRDLSILSHERWVHLRARRPKVFALGFAPPRDTTGHSPTRLLESPAWLSPSMLHKSPARARPFLGWEVATFHSYGSPRGILIPRGASTQVCRQYILCAHVHAWPLNDRKGSDTSEPKVFYGTRRDPQLRFTFVLDAVDYYWRVAIGRAAS